MRRVVSVAVVAALTVTGVALPVVSMPAVAATPVAPELDAIEVDGVDDAAARADGALDAPPEVRLDAATEAAVAAEDARTTVEHEHEHVELEPLASADATDLAALTPLTRTGRFTAVGVTWDAASPEEVLEVTVRIREDGEESEWVALPVAEVLADSERRGTEPLVSAGADAVQARVRTASGREPAGLRIDLVDGGTSRADAHLGESRAASTAAAASSKVLQPAIITRAEWGADESRRRTWGPQDQSASLAAMYVHHTVNSNSYAKKDAAALVRSIYAYHTGSMGWPDIGYQFLVDRFGRLYEGRHGAIDTLPIGAQAGGYNTTTIGVSAIGNFQEARPPQVMLDAIARLLAWKAYQHGLDPNGTARLHTGTSTKSGVHAKPGQTITVNVVQGHRDTNITACPGQYLYARLGAIRAATVALVKDATRAHGPAVPSVGAPVAVTHTAEQSPAQLVGQSTYSWRPVPGAARYELLARAASHGGAFADARGWQTITTTTGTTGRLTVTPGQNRLVAVRAVAPDGERGPITELVRATRGVAQPSIVWAKAWTKEPGADHVDSALRATTKQGATVRVDSVRDAVRIVVVGESGPGHGRTSLSVGGTVLGEVSWDSPEVDPRAVRVLDLATPVSGSVRLTTLDAARVAVTTFAFPRWTTTVGAQGAGGGSTRPAKPVVSKLSATAAPVRLSSKVTLRWGAAARSTGYKVQVRTAKHGKAFGSWRTVATTTGRSHTVSVASGRSVQVGVVATGAGGSSARATFPVITRPVASASVVRSTGAKRWTVSRHGAYFRDFAWSTRAKGAKLSVNRAKDVRTVQVTGARGPGHGRVAVYVGGVRVATLSFSARTSKRFVRYTVKLPRTISGRVTVKTLDAGKVVRVSAITAAR